MTFPFYKSSLNYEESELASLILDNFNLKRDLAEFDNENFKSLEISKETDIELNILSIAILCLHRPNFISDEDAERIEQTCYEVIAWMTKFHHKYTTDCQPGQIHFSRTKLDTYKRELQLCLIGEKGHLPWSIYSSIFHFPLQSKIVEESNEVLERIQNFNSTLKWLISKHTEISFKCFATLNPDLWWYAFPSSKEDLLQHKEKYLYSNKWFDYVREKEKLYEKYKKV
jgi:hypothetical protein